MLNDDEVERILVIAAHPDDIDFGAAGSVAVWTDAGIEVSYCIVTDGDAGGFDPAVARDEIGPIRRAEQTRAAKEVGVDDLHFLGHRDGYLTPTLELRCDIARVIRIVRPQRVVCQSPVRMFDRIYASHPDHLAAGEAAIAAVYPDSRNPFAFPELVQAGHEPWTVHEVWMMAHEQANRFVDITATIDRKVSALLCHESQHTEPERLGPLMRGWASANAATAGLAEGRLAEAFYGFDC